MTGPEGKEQSQLELDRMNEKFQKRPWKTTTAFRDLVLISAVFMLVSVLVYVFGAFELFQDWIRAQPQWEGWHIHDYLFVFVILAFALGIFSLRRWIELGREITERKRVEQERERLIADLQRALADVKHLSGLLPICAGCKKIRDDRGYWSQVESYIAERSEARFTHGLCPVCTKKFFPDLTPEDLDTDMGSARSV